MFFSFLLFHFFLPSQLGVSSNTLNTSKDFIGGVPSYSRYMTNRKQPTTQQESDTKPSVVFHSGAHSHSGTVLREVSFNDVEELMMSCERPLLCSTPSHCLEPSIRETSSFSCDELDKPPPINESTANDQMSKPGKHGMLQKSKQCAQHSPKFETVHQIEDHAKYANAQSQPRLEKRRICSSVEFVSARPHLKKLKER